MSDAVICLIVLAAVIVLFVWNHLPVEIVAIGSAMVLWATGVLVPDQIFAGFGDPVILFIAALFVVSEGLDATGVTTWAGQQLVAHAGGGRRRLVALILLLAAILTALISVNGAVAALLPMVVLMAVRIGLPPSRLVMPLAFAAHAGSLLALTGTPINVIVSEAAVEAGGRAFGFVEFALVGVPLVAGTIAIAVLFDDRLLPRRTPRSIPPDLSRHARTLISQYGLDAGTVRLRIPDSAHLSVESLAASAPPGMVVVGVLADDVLIVRGDQETVYGFARSHGLDLVGGPEGDDLAGVLLNRELGVAEVMVGPRSGMVGDTVFPGMTTDSCDLVILAVQRKGHDVGPGPAELLAGDVLLVQGTWQALDDNVGGDDQVLVVDSPLAVRRQAVPLGPGARRAIVILAGMVVLLATGVVPPAVAALLAAGAMIVLRVLTIAQAYDGISWTTLVIVGGMFPMSIAIQQSGAADLIAGLVVSASGGSGHLLLLGLFLVTAILGQFVSNMATALIIIPVALSAASGMGISVQPVLMCVAVAAAASFLTPVATPANMMVKEPGGYRFTDYWKFGLPMMAWFLVVTMALVPLIWPL